jgi:hypothetical protein
MVFSLSFNKFFDYLQVATQFFMREMLFVTNDLEEEKEESTHDNILRDVDTLILFFLEIMGTVDINKSGDLLLQFFFLDFFNKNFSLFIIHSCNIQNILRDESLIELDI